VLGHQNQKKKGETGSRKTKKPKKTCHHFRGFTRLQTHFTQQTDVGLTKTDKKLGEKNQKKQHEKRKERCPTNAS